MRAVADDVRLLAEKEGLTGHAASVDIRLGVEETNGAHFATSEHRLRSQESGIRNQ
jgi:hypothetical protein